MGIPSPGVSRIASGKVNRVRSIAGTARCVVRPERANWSRRYGGAGWIKRSALDGIRVRLVAQSFMGMKDSRLFFSA
jgi:hypothetical protein